MNETIGDVSHKDVCTCTECLMRKVRKAFDSVCFGPLTCTCDKHSPETRALTRNNTLLRMLKE